MVSHTTTGEWQSFEVRMRRRRAERLLLRAEAAIEAGCLDDARVCLSEAKALDPTLPAIDALEQRLIPEAPTPVPVRSRRRLAAAAIVAAAAIATMFLVARPMVSRSRMPPAAITKEVPTTAPAAVPQPISPPPVSGEPLPSPATVFTAETAAAAPTSAGTPAPPIETVAPKPLAPEPARAEVPAVLRSAEEPAARAPIVDPLPPAESTPGRVTVPPAPPVVAATAPPSGIVTLPIAAAPPPPAAMPAPEPSPEPAVRSALDRYAAAYSALDVDAAQRVWPNVNRGALSRAFDGLASQQISLGNCQIDVAAGSATAQCAGTASWAPKVGGGGPRTEPRQWTFQLARGRAGWEIVSARVQNR